MADQLCGAQWPGSGHEVGPQHRLPAHNTLVAGGGYDRVNPAVSDRGNEEAVRCELAELLWGQAGHTARDDDPIVGGAGGLAEIAVAMAHSDLMMIGV